MTGQERADRIRQLAGHWWSAKDGYVKDLLPPGSVVLTPDELLQVRAILAAKKPPKFRRGEALALLGKEN